MKSTNRHWICVAGGSVTPGGALGAGTCGTRHRSLGAARRCSAKLTDRMRRRPGQANALAMEPVAFNPDTDRYES